MNCFFCETGSSSYKCPKCHLNYCSLDCYRSTKHEECSEAFYKSCIEKEMMNAKSLKSLGPNALKANARHDYMDYDDYDDLKSDSDNDDLWSRFKDLDLDSASHQEILSRLSESQLERFNAMLDSKKILDLIPLWVPCKYYVLRKGWQKTLETKVLNVSSIHVSKSGIDLSYNLLEILFYYVFTCRMYNYDFDESAWTVIKFNWYILLKFMLVNLLNKRNLLL